MLQTESGCKETNLVLPAWHNNMEFSLSNFNFFKLLLLSYYICPNVSLELLS